VTAAFRSTRVVLPDGVRPATVVVRDGVIAGIADHAGSAAGRDAVDAGDLVIGPGLVDTHVHVNEPGRTEWEGFAHATRAAAAGGVTTIVDMPLNSVPATSNAAALEAKRAAAQGRCFVDVGFWGGVVPGNRAELAALARAGVLGFKCFLVPSGVDEFPSVGEEDLRASLPVLRDARRPLLVHAEWPDALRPIDRGADPRRYSTWLDSRPPASEEAAIAMLIDASRRSNAHVHVVHLSAAAALDGLRLARRDGVRITVETCPHYLFFAAEEAGDGDTSLKCAPPIRHRENREELWRGLVQGDIDLVATDHSPAPPALKEVESGDFVRAWGGIASLELGLAVTWTAGRERGADLLLLAQWMSAAPARLAGLHQSKGAIAPGFDADFVIWDPDAEWTVEPEHLHHRHPVTPYRGRRLRGRVVRTVLRGEPIYESGAIGPPRGRLLSRTS
jgi:allantoinase